MIRNILDLVIVIVFVIALVIIIVFTFQDKITVPWLYIPFSVIVFGFIVSVIISFHTRAIIKEWMSIYRILDIWGSNIENESDIKDFSRQLNG